MGQALEGTDPHIVARDNGLWLHEALQGLANGFCPQFHAKGERLQHQMILVTIDDEAGKEVPLAVYQPITLHPRKEPLSALQSRGEARVEEVAIDDLAPLRQDAHRDEGARINVTTPDQRAAMSVDIDA